MPPEPETRPAVPRLLAITRGAADREDLEDWIARLAEAGVDAVQVREKHLEDGDLLRLVARIVEAARRKLAVLVNGRADIAVAAGADGVHLPSRGLPADAARGRWPGLQIGLSCHQLAEIEEARSAVDYVTFGPVFETPSKAAYGRPVGLAALEKACDLGVPVVALGGVEADRLPDLAAAGAAGAAAIRAFQQPETLVEMGARAAATWPDA